MRERRPLFEPDDPRRFDVRRAGGPLTPYYWNQLNQPASKPEREENNSASTEDPLKENKSSLPTTMEKNNSLE